MKQRVYVETSVISYVTAWPSRDLIVAAHQEITRQWWNDERGKYDLYISQAVIGEASAGDAQATRVRPRIDALCRSRGIASPQLCIPEELMEA